MCSFEFPPCFSDFALKNTMTRLRLSSMRTSKLDQNSPSILAWSICCCHNVFPSVFKLWQHNEIQFVTQKLIGLQKKLNSINVESFQLETTFKHILKIGIFFYQRGCMRWGSFPRMLNQCGQTKHEIVLWLKFRTAEAQPCLKKPCRSLQWTTSKELWEKRCTDF